MKIKVINPNTNAAMTAKIGAAARGVASAGTTILAAQPAMGPEAIDTAYDDAFATIGVIDEIRRGELDGCDGYVIACFGDPGLTAAREMTSKPVIGMGEAAFQAASLVCDAFSIISMPERARSEIARRVQHYGVGAKCRSIRMVDVSVLDSEDAETGARRRIEAECRRAILEDHADGIVLGCGGLTDMVEMIGQTIDAPVIDGVAVAVKWVEALLALGLKTSKRQAYGAPIAKPFAGIVQGFGWP